MTPTEPAVALHFDVLPEWEQLPAGMNHDDVVGVCVDSRDRLFMLTRRESRVLVYDRDGTCLDHWGEGLLTERTHGLTVAPDDTVYVVDEGAHVVYHTDDRGEVLGVIGQRGQPSDSGYDGQNLDTIVRGGGPFNRPTNVAVAPSGDLYVSDGYGNCQVHRFTADGALIDSWGEPGTGPGQFHLVHGVTVAANGEVLVADRENDRIQVFTPEGVYLREWTDVQRPTNVRLDADGNVYVSELWRRASEPSRRLGPQPDRPGRVSVFDPAGVLLARWGGPQRTEPGNFIAPHDICVDSNGDVYVGEVSYTYAVSRGHVAPPVHTFQKFARRGSSA